MNMGNTEESRLIFRELRGTVIRLGLLPHWSPDRMDTHLFCIYYKVIPDDLAKRKSNRNTKTKTLHDSSKTPSSKL